MKLRIAVAALCATGSVLHAHAHALLEHADPRVGSVVKAAPAEVKLSFSEPLEGAFSSAEVRDASGKRVDAGRSRVDAQDGRVLHVLLTVPLTPGDYKVIWRVVSVDTHVTSGDFRFRVSP